MIHLRIPLMMLAAAGLIAATASAPGQTPAPKAYQVNVGRKQTFTEIGSDDKTKPDADAEGTGPTVYFGDIGLEGTVAPTEAHGDPARLQRIRASLMPKIDKPILFDTPEADAIVSALQAIAAVRQRAHVRMQMRGGLAII